MGPDGLLPPSHRRLHSTGDDDYSDDPVESSPSATYGTYDDTLMADADDEQDEEEEEEDEEDEEDDDDDDHGTDDHCYGDNHDQYDQHHHFVHQQFLYPPDAYPSDDLEMSDDGGAPLVNYLDVASLLTNDADMTAGFGSDSGYGFFGDDAAAAGADGVVGHPQPGIENHYLPIQNGFAPPLNVPSVVEPAYDAPGAMPNSSTIETPPMNPTAAPQQLEGLADDVDDDGFAVWFPGEHPVALSNPNPNTLGPGNYGLVEFLKHWAGQSPGLQGLRECRRFPWTSKINDLAQTHLTHIQYADLEGNQCDFQGVDWKHLGVTRRDARERRLLTYANYVNKPGSDRWSPHLPDMMLPQTDSFFRFRRMDIRRNVHLSHFQLRNVLASTSRTNAFYTGSGVVHSFNPVSGEGKTAMRLGDMPGSQVSTIAADYGVLIAGGFSGEYILRRLDSYADEEGACHEGTITTHISGITNHVQIHQARQSSSPRAAFASNDMCFRVLDVNTETFLSCESFDYPLNCSALSPDRRLRVMVGDHQDVLITAAESSCGGGRPEILQQLVGHRDHGFACDWADDGWTIATGFQDRSIKIWDARRWTNTSGVSTPVCTLRTEMAGVRSLRFSPLGSGKRVLVAAEEADYVNIIDAQTFASKQTVDFFGEIGGVTFSNNGQDLLVLCCDRVRGGIVQLERCGVGAETSWDAGVVRTYRRESRTFDWPRSRFTEEKRIRESLTRRRRKGAFLDAMEPF